MEEKMEQELKTCVELMKLSLNVMDRFPNAIINIEKPGGAVTIDMTEEAKSLLAKGLVGCNSVLDHMFNLQSG